MGAMKIYRDEDTALRALAEKTVAVIGYGNRGQAQALNLHDCGGGVIVGTLEDESAERAPRDGFTVLPIAEAAARGDVLLLLLPDELQRQVYGDSIRRQLRRGKTLDFAHGFNIRFGWIKPPPKVDVIMVAPRMIGHSVRQRFLDGAGSPAYVAGEQDASGHAWETALALAKSTGAPRGGAREAPFAQ